MKMRFEIGGRQHEVAPQHRAGAVDIAIDGRSYAVAHQGAGQRDQVVTVDGRAHRVVVAAAGGLIFVHALGRAWEVRALDELEAAGTAGAAADHVAAPMPGTVLSVAVAVGDAVAEGAAILVIESMKLETTVRAPRDAVVEALPFAPGSTFDKGAQLVRFAQADDGGEEAEGG